MNTTKSTIDQRFPWPRYDLLYCKTLYTCENQLHMISKYAEKLNMLAEKKPIYRNLPIWGISQIGKARANQRKWIWFS